MTPHTAWPYAGIVLAAAVEGEVVFVAASALVATGVLHPLGVALCGALGAALGDQFFFFAMRSGVTRWLGRKLDGQPSWTVLGWVRRHQTATALAVRFAPGLRITLTALCVASHMPPWRFSVLNAASALVWAVAVMSTVAYGGPQVLASTGLTPVAAVAISAAAVLACVFLSPYLAGVFFRERRVPDKNVMAP